LIYPREVSPWIISCSALAALLSLTVNPSKTSSLYSIVETAKTNGIKPYDYLLLLYNLMPSIKSFTPGILEMLMPWSDQVKETCGYSPVAKRKARDKADSEHD